MGDSPNVELDLGNLGKINIYNRIATFEPFATSKKN